MNYNRKEKQWKIYHRFEKKLKRRLLSRLSGNDGFRILKELHQFAYKLGNRRKSGKLDTAKIELLADIHVLFGKIKS